MLIAHLTDSHIVEKDKSWLAHPLTKTETRLAQAINYLNQLNPRPDIVIFTGDLTDEGTEAAYQHFQEILQPLQIPLFVIPGNHDCRETMRHAFHKSSYIPKQGFLHYTIEDYPLRLIALDTLLEGEGKGGLCEERFQWLQDTLKQDNNKPTLLFMHHPPVKIGMSLFDSIRCFTPTSF